VHAISKIGPTASLVVFPTLCLVLYGALVVPERRSGYIIQLIGGILALGMPGLHFTGKHINEVAQASGGFFFTFTLLLLGTTGLFSVILAVRGLWSLRVPARST